MHPLLAQINSDTVQIAGGMASLFFLVGGINATLRLVDRVRGQPPAEHLAVLTNQMNRRLEHLEALRENDAQEQDERRRAIYTHVEKTRLELKADIKGLEARLSVLPAEIVALLRNTGVIS